MSQIVPASGGPKVIEVTTTRFPAPDAALVDQDCFVGKSVIEQLGLEIIQSLEQVPRSFIATRFTARLTTGQEMAVPDAMSSIDAYAIARRYRSDIESINDYGEHVAYCIEDVYRPILCTRNW